MRKQQIIYLLSQFMLFRISVRMYFANNKNFVNERHKKNSISDYYAGLRLILNTKRVNVTPMLKGGV